MVARHASSVLGQLMPTLVVVPTYEEAENLDLVIARVHATRPDVDVLVVDDASPDGTGRIADALAAADDRVHVMHRPGKQGLGAAYRAGFGWGLERGYDYFVEMDADGSHQPEELGRLLEAAEHGADLVIGSRWIEGGRVVNWPRRRRFISRAGTAYARVLLGLPVHDSTAGYRVLRRGTLERLDLAGIHSQGYCFQIDMTRCAHAAGLSIVEVPVTFVERERGRSKMSGAIVREALWRVTVWGLARLVPGHRRRIGRTQLDPGR
jgi:dolichol-phosphate mannosyltransferase